MESRDRGTNGRWTRRRSATGLWMLVFAAVLAAPAFSQQLDSECRAMAMNRTASVRGSGAFAVGNVPVPIGAFRVRFVCERADGSLDRAYSNFVIGKPDEETFISTVTFADDQPIPVSIEVTAPLTVLTPANDRVQLITTGTLPNGSEVDLTTLADGTAYLPSNTTIATVTPEGLVTAHSSGRVLVTAIHEGSIAAIVLQVDFSGDRDSDGLPDDFEEQNALNPGGVNLARLPGVQVTASSFSSDFVPERAIDGNLLTSWFTGVGDAANLRSTPFIEVTLSATAEVAQVRVLGNRQNPFGFGIFAGVVRAFDAGGTVLFDSGEVPLPLPNRDLTLPVGLAGVQRLRFELTADESNTPGLSEIQLISGPGGPGLDPENPADANADFDGDGLTNRTEFELGTSIFLIDTDGDGLRDDEELALASSPLQNDTDGDGLSDGNELQPQGDSDGDGIVNVLDPDSDGDGLPDGVEASIGLDMTNIDSDGDGLSDGGEDSDFDGLSNSAEVSANTDASDPDTDGDGLTDGEEALPGNDGFVTDPLRADSDGDLMTDGYESFFGLDPTDPSDAPIDSDGDGLTNLEEFELGTDPLRADRVPPQVVSTEPADGSATFPINGVVVVRFAEPLFAGSVVAGTVRLFEAGGGDVDGTVSVSNDGLSVSFTPSSALAGQTPYQVSVDGLTDLARNPMAAPFTFGFTTDVFSDTVTPFVVRSNPVELESGVPANQPVLIEFSEPMDPASFDASTFFVRENRFGAPALPGLIQVEPDGRFAFFIPERPFRIDTWFRFTVGSVRDLAGNWLRQTFSFRFRTGFALDRERPRLLATSPPAGRIDVPRNARIMFAFDEPVNRLTLERGIEVLAGGEPVPGSFSLSSGGRRATFVSAEPLAVSTRHFVIVGTDVTDRVGLPLDNPTSFEFTTGALAEPFRPQVVSIDPPHNSEQVGTNAPVTVLFDKAVNPVTVSTDSFRVTTTTNPVRVPGAYALSDDLRTVIFRPSGGFARATAYRVELTSAILDLAGLQLVGRSIFFDTVPGEDLDPPFLTAFNPPAGRTDVAVNSRAALAFSEPFAAASLQAGTVTLSGGGAVVEAALSFDNDQRSVTLTPDAPLLPDTEYTLRANGITDLSGNVMVPHVSTFRTLATTIFDTSRPAVSTVLPLSGASNVALDTIVEVTFNDGIDPVSVTPDTFEVEQRFSTRIAGTITVDGPRLIFTPAAPLLPDTIYRVELSGLRDYAGNTNFFFRFDFTTTADGSVVDVTPPELVSISPPDGTDEVGVDVHVAMAFSESLQRFSANDDTVGVFAGGERLNTSFTWSSDNTMVIVDHSQPPSESLVTVVATSGIRDLVGNGLAEFSSQFTMADLTVDNTRPTIRTQRPVSGATGAAVDSRVLLMASEPLDPATVGADTVSVLESNIPVFATITLLPGGRIIEIVPDLPFVPGALVHAVARNAKDLRGNFLSNYEAFFRVASDTTALAPSVVRTSPRPNAPDVARNTVVEVEFSEPLEAASVNADTVLLEESFTAVPVTLSGLELIRGGRVIRLTPAAPLVSGTFYTARVLTGVRDLDGTQLAANFSNTFTAGADEDLDAPAVMAVSPFDGATDTSINARLHVLFDEPINPLSVTAETFVLSDASGSLPPCSIGFSSDDRQVFVSPQALLDPETAYVILIEGVEDAAGNAVAPVLTGFTTGNELDTTDLMGVTQNLHNTATDVARNLVFTVEFDDAVDGAGAGEDTFGLRDLETNEIVPGTRSLSPDGRRLSFVPDALLAAGRDYRTFVSTLLTDEAGNRLSSSSIDIGLDFTAGFEADTVRPSALGTSPPDGFSEVPRNAVAMVGFDEPISPDSIGGVRLLLGGVEVAVKSELSIVNDRLTLRPLELLEPLTTYTLEVTGAADRAGNVITAFSTTFTTGSHVRLEPVVQELRDPPPEARDVGTNAVITLHFEGPFNPLTVNTDTLIVDRDDNGADIEGSVSLSSDLRNATFTPDGGFEPYTTYRVFCCSGMRDLTDSFIERPFISNRLTTGAGPDLDPPSLLVVSPPDAAVGAPINAVVTLVFDEAMAVASAGADTFRVEIGGTPVSGRLVWPREQTSVTFVPDQPLLAEQTYTVTADGLTDAAANVLPTLTSTFSTGSDVDTTGPSIVAVSPANGSQGVSVLDPIVFTFDEDVAPHTASGESITIGASGAQFAGDYQVSGAVVTFTPTAPLPGDAFVNITVNAPLADLAGNPLASFFSSFFRTGSGVDTTPPEVVAVSPPDGATGISSGFGREVVVTFSESLDSGIFSGQLVLMANGAILSPDIEISFDFRTFTLITSLPDDSVITLLISGATDLSGNEIEPFRSSFTTVPRAAITDPRIQAMRPRSGSGDVPADTGVVLFADEPPDLASLNGAFFVTADGELVDGTTVLSPNGQTIEFQPAQPFADGAFVQVFLESTVTDPIGTPFERFEGFFNVLGDTRGIAPRLIDTNSPGFTRYPTNAVLDLKYSEPLDPATIEVGDLVFTPDFAHALTLREGGRVLRVTPQAALAPNVTYFYEHIGDMRDLDGDPLVDLTRRGFAIGTEADVVAPRVVFVAPPDGAVEVPLNAPLRVGFDERVNRLTISGTTVRLADSGGLLVPCTISFDSLVESTRITPHAPLDTGELYTVTVDGVEDLGANMVTVTSTQFMAGSVPDFTEPNMVRTHPRSDDGLVPVNTVVELEFDEPIDPNTAGGVTLQPSAQETASVDAGGRVVRLVPAAGLAPDTSYRVRVRFSDISDLAGNELLASDFFFTTSAEADLVPPQLVGTSPIDGQSGVPLNAGLQVAFDEPIQDAGLGQVTLSAGSVDQPLLYSLEDGNRDLILTPVVPLLGLTPHTLTISGVRDLAGNIMPTVVTTLTTSEIVDFTFPRILTVEPAGGATSVPTTTTITLTFDEAVNPLSVDASSFFVETASTRIPVPGTITVAPDGRSATVTPDALLAPSTQYRVRWTSGIEDLAGRTLGFRSPTTFTTGL